MRNNELINKKRTTVREIRRDSFRHLHLTPTTRIGADYYEIPGLFCLDRLVLSAPL